MGECPLYYIDGWTGMGPAGERRMCAWGGTCWRSGNSKPFTAINGRQIDYPCRSTMERASRCRHIELHQGECQPTLLCALLGAHCSNTDDQAPAERGCAHFQHARAETAEARVKELEEEVREERSDLRLARMREAK